MERATTLTSTLTVPQSAIETHAASLLGGTGAPNESREPASTEPPDHAHTIAELRSQLSAAQAELATSKALIEQAAQQRTRAAISDAGHCISPRIGAMGTRTERAEGAHLTDAADRAGRSGDRRDLLAYLRLRRTAG